MKLKLVWIILAIVYIQYGYCLVNTTDFNRRIKRQASSENLSSFLFGIDRSHVEGK